MSTESKAIPSWIVGSGAVLALPSARILGANDDIRLGVIGVGSRVKIGGMGRNEIAAHLKIPGVRFMALCDCDKANLRPEVEKLRSHNPSIKAYTDLRELLDDKNIDAVIVTTPNHWHALATIWACQAGKDVYVQKPRPIRSSKAADGRGGGQVQPHRPGPNGSRERTGFAEALDYVRQGNLGKVLYAHGLNYKPRESIGKVSGPQPIPATLDYDLWCGPADKRPLMRENLHYDWHWDWHYGNGDLGNMGIHYLDGCRWGLGQNALPRHVISIGGRFGYEDDGQTPNTQIIFFDYDPAPVLFEVRGLPKSKAQRKATWRASDMDEYHGMQIATIIRCENGYVANRSSGGTAAYDNSDKLIQKFEPATSGPAHELPRRGPQPPRGRPRLPRPAGPLLRVPRPHGQHLIPLGQRDVTRGDPGDRQRRKDRGRGVRPLPHPSRRQRDRPEEDADPHGPDAHDGPADRAFHRPLQRRGEYVHLA